MSYYSWRPYVSVAQRRAKALKQMQKLQKKGKKIEPVEIEGRTIARSFWGKAWCNHLESFSDFSNRLPRGRTYARNGSVCHLEILPGKIKAIVSGSELYNVSINIKPLRKSVWKSIRKQCSGKIGSMLELLQGKLSDYVMGIVTKRKNGLMPLPCEIKLGCDCPDWATMCKHVAAALYGIGNRLDAQPELLFVLRGVDAGELISGDIDMTIADANTAVKTITDDKLADIFGADIDLDIAKQTKPATKTHKKRSSRQTKPLHKKRKPIVRAQTGKAKTKAGNTKKLPRIRPTGKSVARLRKQSKLSVAQFAKRIGVSGASIYRWGKITARLKLQDNTLRKLAKLQQQVNRK
ncbi:hypothetical protein ACFL3G_11000 [Planctomycetota bacterium]